MTKLTFLGLAEKILREANRPLSPSEMWKTALSKGYDKLVETEGKTPAATLASKVLTNERDHADSIFVRLGQRPARYFIKELLPGKDREIERALAAADDSTPSAFDYKEADLHPFMAYFARMHFRTYTKTIIATKGRRKAFGEWLHPDMIGIRYAFEDWKPDVLTLSEAAGNPAIKLYSFELKKSLSFENLREAFFQAVSNSSWAHEGYLAAAEVSTDEDFLVELRRLSAAFGIGVIAISLEDPDASEIIVQALERDAVDWDTLNTLAKSTDVSDFLQRVSKDVMTKDPRIESYDQVLKLDELIKKVTRK